MLIDLQQLDEVAPLPRAGVPAKVVDLAGDDSGEDCSEEAQSGVEVSDDTYIGHIYVDGVTKILGVRGAS